ncbi:hypothetical protein ACFLYG_01175 [Chloroflexota bacterium]
MICARPDIHENDLVKLERSIPTGFNPGEIVPIAVSITAKVPLQRLKFSDVPSPRLKILDGKSDMSWEDVDGGTVLRLEYGVQADNPGAFYIDGQIEAKPHEDSGMTLTSTSVLSSGFVYSREETESYSVERWINPASNAPSGNFPVTMRITAKVRLESVHIDETPPEGFTLVKGETTASFTKLDSDDSVTHVYVLQAGDSTGIFEIVGTVLVEHEGATAPQVEMTTPLYVFPRIEISSRDDPAWQSEIGPRLMTVVNSHSVNQHLFLANGLRLVEERLNVGIASELRPEISRDFYMPEISGVEAEVGGMVQPHIFIAIAQNDMTIYPIKEVILQDEKYCEEADDKFDFDLLKDIPDEPFEPGPDPGLGSNFDTVLEVQRQVFDVGLRFFVNELRATNQDTHTLNLPLGLGSITGIIDSVEVPAIRSSATPGQVLADLRGDFSVVTNGIFRLLTGGGTVSLEFQNIGVDLTQTPSGVPTGIKAILTALRLGRLHLNLKGILGWLLSRTVPPVLRFGIWLALRFIQSVDVPVWPLVDAFSKLGLIYANGSPFLTAISDSVLLATDFKPHDNAGIAAGLQHIIPPATSIGVAVNERLLNQLVTIAIAKGYIPRTTRVGGVRLNLSYLKVHLQPGDLCIEGQLKGKRRGCLCGVKARITFDIKISPRIETDQTTSARILVLSGTPGDAVAFGPTARDSTTAEELALHCVQPVQGTLSDDLSSFSTLTSATPALDITIDNEGPYTATLASVPANLSQVQSLLEDAIHNAHSSPAFLRAQVLVVGSRLLVLSGNIALSQPGIRVVCTAAASDPTTARELALDVAQSVQGFLSGDLSSFPALTSTIPEVQVTIGNEGPHTVTLASVPANLSQALSLLEDAIHNAHSSLAFTQSNVVAAVADTPALAFDFDADVDTNAEVGGFIGVTLWMTFGILLISLWAMLNHIFNNNLNQLISKVGTQIINNSLPAQTGPVNISISGLSPSGMLGIRFNLALTGAGLVSLQPFTCAPLNGQWLRIAFNTRSFEVDDQEIRLAVGLS